MGVRNTLKHETSTAYSLGYRHRQQGTPSWEADGKLASDGWSHEDQVAYAEGYSDGGPLVISQAEYERSKSHGYAGTFDEMQPETVARWQARGATHWQLRGDDSRGTGLVPVIVR